jgi:hypothetical protein
MPIPGPKHDLRAGAHGVAASRLVIVAVLCALQYWLLTSAMEAFHAGDRGQLLVAAITSAACFLLAAGLVVAGELAATQRRRRETDRSRGGQ